MTLENLVQIRQLKVEAADKREFAIQELFSRTHDYDIRLEKDRCSRAGYSGLNSIIRYR